VSVAVVVGNPKAGSRTLAAAEVVAAELAGRPPDVVVDLVQLGPDLLAPSSPRLSKAVADVQASSLTVFASPTYKASFTGILKLFLDAVGTGSLAGVTAVALMLGGDLRHSLAPEVFLKPVLNELGASCPVPGLFLLERNWDDPSALAPWLERARPLLVPLGAGVP
jgi:FMN reductase